MGVSKAIYITTVSRDHRILPAYSPQVEDSTSPIMFDHDDFITSDGGNPRKRQRLDHLSAEEKLMRRKMKNREAAQSARDRKKALMDKMEHDVQILNKRNAALVSENRKLQERLRASERENEMLRRKLTLASSSSTATTATDGVTVSVKEEEEVDVVASSPASETFEHASPVSEPLQKDQVSEKGVSQQQQAALAVWLLALLASAAACTTPASTTMTKKSAKKHHLCLRRTICSSSCGDSVFSEQETTKSRLVRWWGPQQRMWSPPREPSHLQQQQRRPLSE